MLAATRASAAAHSGGGPDRGPLVGACLLSQKVCKAGSTAMESEKHNAAPRAAVGVCRRPAAPFCRRRRRRRRRPPTASSPAAPSPACPTSQQSQQGPRLSMFHWASRSFQPGAFEARPAGASTAGLAAASRRPGARKCAARPPTEQAGKPLLLLGHQPGMADSHSTGRLLTLQLRRARARPTRHTAAAAVAGAATSIMHLLANCMGLQPPSCPHAPRGQLLGG